MNFNRNQLIIIGIGFLIIVFFVLVFIGVIPGIRTSTQTNQQVNLTVWGTEDESVIGVLTSGYGNLNPNAKIVYTKFSEADYQNNLISALAAGKGPDVLMFKSSWLPKHGDKVRPVSDTQFSITQLRSLFPKVVEQNFVANNQIYALPFYIDTLAMIYNKDFFDAKTVALVPQTWADFENLIPKLREMNQSNQLTKEAAAIGGSETSIDSASDLLNFIFMQYRNPSLTSGAIRFDQNGLSALNFYLQFANPASPYYTWNDNLPYSIDSFAGGKVAMIFNYNDSIRAIKTKNPFLDLRIAAMPAVSRDSLPISQASYWGLAVSKQSRNPAWAWDFIINAASNTQIADAYLKTSKRPPALNVLINKYLNDPDLGIFAKQSLTARAWPESDSDQVSQIFTDMIKSVLSGRLSPQQALTEAENKINSIR